MDRLCATGTNLRDANIRAFAFAMADA